MRFAIIVAALTIMMTHGAEAMLFRGPWITSVAIGERDPDAIYLRIECSPCKAAFSTDGGATFHALDERMIPNGLTTNLSSGTRKYVLCDKARLLRSDVDGTKWTNTAASAFLRDQSNLDIEREKKEFYEEYINTLAASAWIVEYNGWLRSISGTEAQSCGTWPCGRCSFRRYCRSLGYAVYWAFLGITSNKASLRMTVKPQNHKASHCLPAFHRWT